MFMPPPMLHKFADEIISRYESGETTVAIGESLGFHDSSIGRFLNRRGINTTRVKTVRVESKIHEAIAMHQSGHSIESVAEKFGVSSRVIGPLFKKYGAKLHKESKRIPDHQQAELARLYREGQSTYSLASDTGISPAGIMKCIARQKVAARPLGYRNRRLPLNETVFDEITEESAYWAGFLMGDGCVSIGRNGHRLMLSLAQIDREHVEKFRDFLGSKHAIVTSIRGDVKINKTYNPNVRREMATLVIPSKRLCDAVGKFGVVPRKTFYATASHDLEFNRNFWRGMIDSDGCIYRTRSRIAPFNLRPSDVRIFFCSASERLVMQFQEFVKKHVQSKASILKNRNLYRLSLSGNPAISLIKVLYQDCSVALPRKLKLANFMEFTPSGTGQSPRP
jgi:hypothetical protein